MQIKFISLLTLVLAGLTSAFAQSSLVDLDIFQFQYADNPQISPDGNKLIYTRHQFDIMEDKAYDNLWWKTCLYVFQGLPTTSPPAHPI